MVYLSTGCRQMLVRIHKSYFPLTTTAQLFEGSSGGADGGIYDHVPRTPSQSSRGPPYTVVAVLCTTWGVEYFESFKQSSASCQTGRSGLRGGGADRSVSQRGDLMGTVGVDSYWEEARRKDCMRCYSLASGAVGGHLFPQRLMGNEESESASASPL